MGGWGGKKKRQKVFIFFPPTKTFGSRKTTFFSPPPSQKIPQKKIHKIFGKIFLRNFMLFKKIFPFIGVLIFWGPLGGPFGKTKEKEKN